MASVPFSKSIVTFAGGRSGIFPGVPWKGRQNSISCSATSSSTKDTVINCVEITGAQSRSGTTSARLSNGGNQVVVITTQIMQVDV